MSEEQLKKRLVYISIVVSLFLAGGAWFDDSLQTFKKGKVIFSEPEIVFDIEIAETEDQRAQGLMYRELLALNAGMLFIFEAEGIQRVWMKNTLIALDVIFLSNKGKVVSILQYLKPCKRPVCEIYTSKVSAKYMLEVNAGVVKKAGLMIGQQSVFSRL